MVGGDHFAPDLLSQHDAETVGKRAAPTCSEPTYTQPEQLIHIAANEYAVRIEVASASLAISSP